MEPRSKRPPLDYVRHGLYSIVLGVFVVFTVNNYDFDPYPNTFNPEDKAKWEAAGLDESQLKSGDLILRHSRGFVSDQILSFNAKEARFSHSGIIRKINGKTYVYHASGGEENTSNEMKADPIELFCHPSAVFSFAIYRWDLSPEVRREFIRIMDQNYVDRVEFDLDFEMETDDKMYCSEMIYKAISLATKDKNFIHLSTIGDKPYVAVDELYINDHSNLIFEYDYD